MTNKKITEKEIFAKVIEKAELFGADANLMQEWAEKHIGQLERKYASKSGKLSAKQVENNVLKERIVDIINGAENPLRVMDIIALDGFEDFTSQKISALLKQLVDDKLVSKYNDKRVTYFVPYDAKYDKVGE
jgi:molybdopterin converting factor small subunit